MLPSSQNAKSAFWNFQSSVTDLYYPWSQGQGRGQGQVSLADCTANWCVCARLYTQAWSKTPPVLPTGFRTRTSCVVTAASATSPPGCPSTTAVPVGRACATTAHRSAARCRRGAGTTRCASARPATRNPANFNAGEPSSLRDAPRPLHPIYIVWHRGDRGKEVLGQI